MQTPADVAVREPARQMAAQQIQEDRLLRRIKWLATPEARTVNVSRKRLKPQHPDRVLRLSAVWTLCCAGQDVTISQPTRNRFLLLGAVFETVRVPVTRIHRCKGE